MILNAAFYPVPTPGRRWCAGAFFALQNYATPDGIHQGKASPYANGLTWNELPSVVAMTEGNCGQIKFNVISVVALPSIVAVQNTIPEDFLFRYFRQLGRQG